MNNIVSCAKEHMESFDVRPLNRVDSLILSELSYFQLPQELSKARGWRLHSVRWCNMGAS